MVTRTAAGNISAEATTPAGNILGEATRHCRTFAFNQDQDAKKLADPVMRESVELWAA